MAVPLVGSARFEVCVGSAIGRRPTMEDEVVVVGMGPAHNPNEDFFGVFDGHGGREAAIYAARNLYPKICRNFALSPNEPLKSITNAFEETNAWMLQSRIGSGSTAAISFVVDSTLYTANVGDTRVVLGWKDRKAVRLSFDHKPSVATEKERIERLGGEVTKKFGIARVNGVLGVSRAFGDCKLVPYVSAVPHINILELTDETMFLIIACDGLWDEFSDQEAVELVFEKAATIANMGEYLSNMAIMRGSQDNVSVIVVFLNPRAALYEEDEEEDEEDETDDEEAAAPVNSSTEALPVYSHNENDDEDSESDHPQPRDSMPRRESASYHSAASLRQMMSRTIISSAVAHSNATPEYAAPRSSFQVVHEEEDDDSESDDEPNSSAGLGVGDVNAWVEDDDDE